MKVVVAINGIDYPCRPTMGAMLRFKKVTGKEVTEITNNSISDLVTYIYCCVVSACAVDKKEFKLTLEEFADNLSADDMNAWAESMAANAAGEEKKS